MLTLAEHIRAGPLAPDDLLAFARALAERVGQDHALDLARGDLAPHTLRWDGSRQVELPATATTPSTPDPDDGAPGTASLAAPGYLSPEQVRGEAPGPRSDVFVIGILLYLAATGEHPFAEEDRAVRLADIESRDARPPGYRRHELPLEWDGILGCCLHKLPEERYASALDLARDLEQLARRGGTRRRIPYRIRWGRVALAATFIILLSTLLWLL